MPVNRYNSHCSFFINFIHSVSPFSENNSTFFHLFQTYPKKEQNQKYNQTFIFIIIIIFHKFIFILIKEFNVVRRIIIYFEVNECKVYIYRTFCLAAICCDAWVFKSSSMYSYVLCSTSNNYYYNLISYIQWRCGERESVSYSQLQNHYVLKQATLLKQKPIVKYILCVIMNMIF